MIKKTKDSVVNPSVKFANDTKEHALTSIISDEDAPVIQSVGIFKIPSTNHYVSFVMHTKGTQVVKIDVEEPNLRGIAEESAKISFVSAFMSGEIND